jgi:hypothetical protein
MKRREKVDARSKAGLAVPSPKNFVALSVGVLSSQRRPYPEQMSTTLTHGPDESISHLALADGMGWVGVQVTRTNHVTRANSSAAFS